MGGQAGYPMYSCLTVYHIYLAQNDWNNLNVIKHKTKLKTMKGDSLDEMSFFIIMDMQIEVL